MKKILAILMVCILACTLLVACSDTTTEPSTETTVIVPSTDPTDDPTDNPTDDPIIDDITNPDDDETGSDNNDETTSVADVITYLSTLLGGYESNPLSYIPDTMQYTYAANLVDSSTAQQDYTSYVSTQDIVAQGFGEQWYMIQENILQSQTFFDVLTAVEGLTTTSVTVFSNYIDSNPEDTANYQFASGIYNVTIKLDDDYIYYILDYTATIPVLGEQSVQIAMYMDIDTEVKTVRIQLGDDNALLYTVAEDYYTFGLKYLGVRTAYFEISTDDDGNTTGHVYEILSVAGVGTSSSADFYITDEYVSAVGNKASGLTGFTGTIVELYNVSTGKLVGYEVSETLSLLSFDTLWFDLSSISGIYNIKAIADDDGVYTFYVNSSATAFESKTIGGINEYMFSRRFDIEMRTQYFYSYDADTDSYEVVEVQVPMLFVQEDYLDDLSDDMYSTNGITVTVNTSTSALDKLMSDYATMIYVFTSNKELVTADIITAYIGDKITF